MPTKTANKTATVNKTTVSPKGGALLPLGAHPGNTGGKKGRSGRPPNAFKDFLAAMRIHPKVRKAFQSALSDEESRGFGNALKVLTDYDPDKPAGKQEVTGKGGGPIEHSVIEWGGTKVPL